METVSGAELLVEGLAGAGVQHVFGVPGDTGVALYDALAQRQEQIRHILARDERHAAKMADAYARARNHVGVVEVSSGGGASFVVGGLGESFAASTPLLLISTDIHARSRGSGALTELDQEALFSAVTKWRATVHRAADLPGLLVEALRRATTGRPAPTALIVPEDVLDDRTERRQWPIASTEVPRDRPSVDDGVLIKAAQALSEARRPAIVAGGGVHLSGAYNALRSVAERGGIPVATSIHGKGSYPEGAPWSLGVAGANGAREHANDYLSNADAVLLVGTRANATDTNSFTAPPRTNCTIIQVDIDADRVLRNYPAGIPVIADAKTALESLVEVLPERDEERATELVEWCTERRQRWCEAVPPEVDGRVHPAAVIRELQKGMPPDTVVVSDCGTPTPFTAAYWEADGTERNPLIPRGHGPMGYAIPGAIGAALAHPGRPVLALTTDGSFAMACGELETVARLQLPIMYVQFTNDSFGWIKMLQHLYHEGRYFGVDLGTVDARAAAEAFGLTSVRVSNIDDLRGTIARRDPTGGPLYVDVPVPSLSALHPPVAPWQAALAADGPVERPVY